MLEWVPEDVECVDIHFPDPAVYRHCLPYLCMPFPAHRINKTTLAYVIQRPAGIERQVLEEGGEGSGCVHPVNVHSF